MSNPREYGLVLVGELPPELRNAERIEEAAKKIARLIADPVKLKVISSSSENGQKTAEQLFLQPWVNQRVLGNAPSIAPILDKDYFENRDKQDRLKSVDQVQSFADTTVKLNKSDSDIALVLVAGQNFVEKFPAMFGGVVLEPVDTAEHGSVNRVVTPSPAAH